MLWLQGNLLKDTIPPCVLGTSPPANSQGVELNARIWAYFSEPIDTANLDSTAIHVKGKGGWMEYWHSYSSYHDSCKLFISPYELFEGLDTIEVILSGNICDTSGNGLDGNGNGISEGSPVDDYVWKFFTKDYYGPPFQEWCL